MPKLKVDHIVSFSTEDPIHVANNVLSSDTSKKWKCQTTGEKSAFIILQLEKASVISSIDIGNEHSAYVEVLVKRSSTPDDFKVLLVMSAFMSPLEARQSTNANKVRMFGYNELQNPERDQKWDRVKIVCTQPFNRHVQYGLAFITLHASGANDSNSTVPLKLGNFALRPMSPDNLSVGSLFARRKELTETPPRTAAAAIREASTTTALAHGSPKCKPRLKDTSLNASKQDVLNNSNNMNDSSGDSSTSRSRNRNELLYCKDEEEPNNKIDKLIEQKNKEFREKRERIKKEESKKNKKQTDKKDKTPSKHEKNNINLGASSSSKNDIPQSTDKHKRKLNGKDTPLKKIKVDRQRKPFNQLLSGVTIVISGIQNPERANIRTEALALGAKYKADWDNTCTHLICAFTNTPKFNQVKGKGKIVNRIWIQDCHSQRKRLPWRRYALDTIDQNKNESEDEICEQRADSPEVQVILDKSDNNDSTDTEDEIERIIAFQKAKKTVQQTCFSVDTDEENSEPQNKKQNAINLIELPDFFSNKVFHIDKSLSEKVRLLLKRYITAFDGILLEDPGDIVDFVISEKSRDDLRNLCPDAEIVNPDWIWECHNAKQLLPFDQFKL